MHPDVAERPGAQHRLVAALLALTEPAASVASHEGRRRARMLAALLAVMIPASLFSSIVVPAVAQPGLSPWERPLTLMGLAASAVGVALYLLSRSPHHAKAAYAAVLFATLTTWVTVALSEGTPSEASAPYFLGLGVVLSSLLLPLRFTAALAAANTLGVLVVPRVVPAVSYFDALNAGLFIGMVSGLMVVFAAVRHRDLRHIEAQARDLAESEAELRSVLSHAPVIILRIDADGHIRFINRPPSATFGSIVGRTVYEFAPDEDRSRLTGIVARVFATGQAESYEIQGPRADGSPGWYTARLGPVMQADRVESAMLITADITEMKQAQEERAQSLERAREIERLREVAQFKTNLINMAAHELRTPMTPLQTQVYLLRKRSSGNLNDEQRRSLEVLDRNLRRMSDLLQDVLESARIEAGKLEVHPQPCDLRGPVLDVAEAFRGVASEAGVALEVDLPPALVVEADPARMAQVLLNLVGNAVKFTPRGGSVRVSGRVQGGVATLEVADTGPGLSEDQVARLFLPFSQVHAGKPGGGGTGLGLYISREIVEMHHGRLWCRSEGPGKGATFVVELPPPA